MEVLLTFLETHEVEETTTRRAAAAWYGIPVPTICYWARKKNKEEEKGRLLSE